MKMRRRRLTPTVMQILSTEHGEVVGRIARSGICVLWRWARTRQLLQGKDSTQYSVEVVSVIPRKRRSDEVLRMKPPLQGIVINPAKRSSLSCLRDVGMECVAFLCSPCTHVEHVGNAFSRGPQPLPRFLWH